MNDFVQRVVDNTSRAEWRAMNGGERSIAVWLSERVCDLDGEKAERVADSVMDLAAESPLHPIDRE